MNLIKLEVLVLIGKHHKITTVAELLGLKQPTVTFHMKSLEKETGVRLFQSYPNKIALTEAGQALSHYAVKILALQEESRRVLNEYQVGRLGSLRIGASNVPATYVLPRLFGQFQLLQPKARISLLVNTAPNIHAMLLKHEIDVGIISASDTQTGIVKYEALCGDELVFTCLPSHPLAQESNWNVERIAQENFILHDDHSSTRKMCEAWAAKCGIQFNTRLVLGSSEAIKQAVMSGIGVSILSRTAIEPEVKKGEIWYRPLPGDMPKRHIFLGVNRDRMISPLLNHWIIFLRQSFAD